jgi:signal transduction histidine kinase
MDRTGTA